MIAEQQSIDVPVQREEVYITKRAVNRPAMQADLDMMDREIKVPRREQEVVTSKQVVVRGRRSWFISGNLRTLAVVVAQEVADTHHEKCQRRV